MMMTVASWMDGIVLKHFSHTVERKKNIVCLTQPSTQSIGVGCYDSSGRIAKNHLIDGNQTIKAVLVPAPVV